MTEIPVKVSAEVDPQGTNKLIDALVDAFSPATETLGLLGDAMRLARVEVAAVVTRRAKEIADTNGLELKAPPIKFLAPFFEKASLEAADDTEVIEMWSQLLVSAATEATHHPHFVSILSGLETSQATLLRDIFFGVGRLHDPVSDRDEELVAQVEPFNAILNELTERDFDAIFQWAVSDGDTPLDRVIHGVRKRFCGRAVFCARMRMWSGSAEGTSSFRVAQTDRHLRALDQLDVDVLRALNLLERFSFSSRYIRSDDVDRPVYFVFEVYAMTDLALKFLSSIDLQCRRYLDEKRKAYESRFA